MKRLASIALAGTFTAACCCVVGWQLWNWQENLPGGKNVVVPSAAQIAKQNANPQAALASLEISGDDRAPEALAYQTALEQKAEAVLRGQAAERGLPTMALPILQSRLPAANPTVAQTLSAELARDHVRLGNALTRQKCIDWYRKKYLDEFEKNAKSKAWAVSGRVVIQASLRALDGDPMVNWDEPQIIWREGRRASALHCNDPLVLEFWIKDLIDYGDKDAAWIDSTAAWASDTIESSKSVVYSPIVKLEAVVLAAEALARDKPDSPQRAKKIEAYINRAKKLFPQFLAGPEIPRMAVISLFDELSFASVSIYGDRRALPSQFFDALNQSSIDPSTVLTVQGRFNVNYAWDARGSGWGDTVTPQGMALMAQRLAKADAALEKAWQLDPTNSIAASEMIRVELGQGQGRDRMERWFSRAMQADPDNLTACEQKLYYLEPKWYGSADEMLNFGRQCVAGGNWDAGIPYILFEAHMNVSHYTSAGWQPAPQPAYFQNNPQVWSKLRSTYAEDRKHMARSVFKELQFAKVACWTGHWDEANQMFREAGGANHSFVWTDDEFNQAREEARRHPPATRPSEI